MRQPSLTGVEAGGKGACVPSLYVLSASPTFLGEKFRKTELLAWKQKMVSLRDEGMLRCQLRLGLGCLTPFSTLFQLYRSG